ncbi:MAG: hypothetical protein U9P38_00105, partial [Campylobacterota bacterium]|nr:hypothetical protein [Campylobacterota bacterium]
LEIGYGYRSIRQDSFEDSYTNYAESLETVKISYMQYKNWLRHGANIAYSTTEGKYISPRTYGFDVTYLAAFQLTTFGVEDSSLTLFNTFALVPYFGFEVGLGTLKMYNESTKESYYEFEEGDDFSAFVNNYVVAKGVVGMDVVFSEQIAFGLRYSKEMTLLDSQNFAIYVSLSL